MSERYKAVEGSESAHCCFGATVVDTRTPHPIFANDPDWVCECYDMETAQKIADAMNAAQQPAAKVLAKGYFHPLPDENYYEFHDAEQFPDGNDCPTCVPAEIVRRGTVENQLSPEVTQLVEALERISNRASAAECKQVPCSPIQRLFVDIMQQADDALAAHRKGGEV